MTDSYHSHRQQRAAIGPRGLPKRTERASTRTEHQRRLIWTEDHGTSGVHLRNFRASEKPRGRYSIQKSLDTDRKPQTTNAQRSKLGNPDQCQAKGRRKRIWRKQGEARDSRIRSNSADHARTCAQRVKQR